jgi:hypothetical protein
LAIKIYKNNVSSGSSIPSFSRDVRGAFSCMIP